MTTRASRLFLAAALACGALALTGCGTKSEFAGEPDYKAGHSDGCWTATSRVPGDPSTVTRNEGAWNASEAYRAGWKAGYSACRIRDDTGGGMGMPATGERGPGVH
ncbi:MAG: hypothetical protein CVT73_08695 [Alphaproteobacteria bacterium HGW-Alphaproteobacteria-12]|nr:MAG: hypothetical protein CVT73_08695 [Alphaproteobacteria bacterium HGW-Alphaproteobacteria-12]